MSLAAGTRVGPYEVLAPLGAGGMGEVFRAHDTRLAREVAVKVLPARLSNDADALARFEREAKAVAALSHPNILSIFDFGRHDGTAYAVTELLEGETLRERMKAGALPTRKVAELAIQVAHGLAAAHAKGIVHRDLKPENVFLSRDGHVKILDFGLARQAASAPLGSDSVSPTEAHQTEPGTVLGTVGYMSPEQVRGQTVDHRSDIFSLGSVIFEMATGGPAFKRDTAAETMTAILREDPLEMPEPASRSARLAPGLERVLRHCLEKSPDERFQSARDLAFDLESLSGTTHSGAVPASAASERRFRVSPALLLLAAAALLGLGYAAGRGLRTAPRPATPPVATFTQLTFQAGALSYPSVSPEGQSFVFVRRDGDLDIHLQRTGGANAINLTADSPVDDSEPAFSPDGSQIAFRSEREGGGLFVMGATGESVRRLTDGGYNPTWSPDGREVAFSTAFIEPLWPYARSERGVLWSVHVSSGEKRRLSPEGQDVVQPSWSPSGERIAFWGLRGGGQRDLWTIARSGETASLTSLTDDPELDWGPVWAPDGRHLYFSSDRGGTLGLWRVAIDEASGRAAGPPEPLAVPFPSAAYPSFTRDGRKLVLAGAFATDSIQRLAFDPVRGVAVGEPSIVFASSLRLFYVGVSADGGRVAFTSGGRREDLYTLGADGNGLRQLTNDAYKDRGPVFLPDGKRLLIYSTRSGQYEVWSLHTDGSGAVQVTRTEGDEVVEPRLSPDGTRLVVSLTHYNGSGVARFDPTGPPSATERLPNPESGSFDYPVWSNDGTRLAGIVRSPAGRQGLGLYTLATKTHQLLDVDGQDPHWLHDDRALLFLRSGELRALDLGSRREHSVVTSAGLGPDRAGDQIYAYALSGDQRSLFLVVWRNQADVWQLALPAER